MQQQKLYTFKLRNANDENNAAGLDYFDNSILFKKQNRSRSRAKKALNDDDWLTAPAKNGKQNDFELLKDLLYSSLVNENKVGSRNRSTFRNSSSSSSGDSRSYYRSRPIEFLDENVFFEEKPPPQNLNSNQTSLVEMTTSNEESPDDQTIESLIEELDAELKKSNESSICSSPNVSCSQETKNNCTCDFLCQCKCHTDKFSFVRLSSNSSSINSRNSSRLIQSNSPFSVRRISRESLEWDISLDKMNSLNEISNNSPLDKSECVKYLVPLSFVSFWRFYGCCWWWWWLTSWFKYIKSSLQVNKKNWAFITI